MYVIPKRGQPDNSCIRELSQLIEDQLAFGSFEGKCMWEAVGIGFTAIIAFVVLFFMLLMSLSNGMNKVAKAFFAAIREKDYPTAYLHVSSAIGLQVENGDFQRYLTDRYLGEIDHVTGYDYYVVANGRAGQVWAKLVTSGEFIVPITMSLMKVKGAWKISSIEVHVQVARSEVVHVETSENIH